MAKVSLLQNQWDRGIRRDKARSDMPPGTLWDAVDVILSYGAPIRQRGGWAHHSQDLISIPATSATTTYVKGGIYATFSNSAGTETAVNVAVDEDGQAFNATTAGAATHLGTINAIIQNPVFHGGTAVSAATAVYTGLVITPDGYGVVVPTKYNGSSAPAPLNGSPPKARYAAVYKDYTVLGNGTVGTTYYPDRIWFSPEGDPDCAVSSVTAWDTTDSWIGLSAHVKGLGATRNALLVFHDSSTSRIRGAIPPPDEDMIVDDSLFSVGLYDAFSIATHGDTIIWASEEGVHRSDGAILDSLTARGGMTRYWLDLTANATSAWTFSGGVLRDTYFLCVMDGVDFVDCFSINLQNLAWTRHSNIDATSFWSGQLNRADELYWGRRNAAKVARLSTIYSVGDSDYKLDGDDDAVLPSIETQFYVGKEFGPKRIRRAFLSYELTDYDDDNPLCTMSYVLTPEETSYTDVVSLDENDGMERDAFHIDKQAQGIAFKFERTYEGIYNGAGDFLLYALELEAWPYEQSRRI